MRKTTLFVATFVGLILSGLSIGCEAPPPPYVPKALHAPPVIHCNDYTGHKAGTRPWIMGGTCTCTPTQELMEQLNRDGFCTDMTADSLRARYVKAGIKLRGPGHMRCNGICQAGPHVILGGKCMCPPTPGTAYYERIIIGTGTTAHDAQTSIARKP